MYKPITVFDADTLYLLCTQDHTCMYVCTYSSMLVTCGSCNMYNVHDRHSMYNSITWAVCKVGAVCTVCTVSRYVHIHNCMLYSVSTVYLVLSTLYQIYELYPAKHTETTVFTPKLICCKTVALDIRRDKNNKYIILLNIMSMRDLS